MSTPILKFSGKKINLHSNYIGLGRCPLSIVWIYDRWTGDEIQVVRQACYGYPIKKRCRRNLALLATHPTF